MMRRSHKVNLEDLRRRFPIGATIYYKDNPVGTVCGYNTWINESRENEPEVKYVIWKVLKCYGANKIGQFTIRSPHFKTKPFELSVYEHHSSGIGSMNRYRKITVWFNPKDYFEHGKVWFDETNREWAIWANDLYKIIYCKELAVLDNK